MDSGTDSRPDFLDDHTHFGSYNAPESWHPWPPSPWNAARDVGLMKALGGSVPRIMRLFLTEAAALGLIGGTIGFFIGVDTRAVDLEAACSALPFRRGWKFFRRPSR